MAPEAVKGSDRVEEWISDNVEILKPRVTLLQRLQERDKAEVMKEALSNPTMFSDAWSEIISAMEETGAPPDVRSAAEELAEDVRKNVKQNKLSRKDREELVGLVDDLKEARSLQEMDRLVEQAVHDGRLSRRVGHEMIQYVQSVEEKSGEVTPQMAGRLGACGFCGALGLASCGPGCGLAACVVCAAFAEP